MVNNNNSVDDGRNYFTNLFYSLFGKKNKNKTLQINEQAQIKEEFSMKTEPLNRRSRNHTRRSCKSKRKRDKCNSNTNPLLRYFRLWCPCFCCCKTENKSCCNCCPYKNRYAEKYRKNKLLNEDHKQNTVSEKSKKKSSKSNVDSEKMSNTKLTIKSSQKQKSKYEINNKSRSEKVKSVNFTCFPSKTDAGPKNIECKCGNRNGNLEFYPPEMRQRLKQNGIPFIRKRK